MERLLVQFLDMLQECWGTRGGLTGLEREAALPALVSPFPPPAVDSFLSFFFLLTRHTVSLSTKFEKIKDMVKSQFVFGFYWVFKGTFQRNSEFSHKKLLKISEITDFYNLFGISKKGPFQLSKTLNANYLLFLDNISVDSIKILWKTSI